MTIKSNKKICFMYFFTIIFWGVFYYFLPFAGDDWAWGSEVGIQRLQNGFAGYNGRYLGNLLIILITRSVIAKLLICSLTMFLLIFILSKIFDGISGVKNTTQNYMIAFCSVLVLVLPNQIAFGELQPFQIFGSTIGWLSGFTNYVVPSVLILVFYYFATNKGFQNKKTYLLLFIVGISACLCVEHYTLFCLIFGFGIIVYRYYFHKFICKKSLSFFIGSLVGALIMFTNSSYQLMQKGDVSKNQRAVGFLGSFKSYANYIFPKNTNETLTIIFEVVLIILIISLLFFFAVKICKAIINQNISNILPLICMLVMTVPLLFTNSGKEIYIIAPRCYFLQYFMLMIFFYKKYFQKHKFNTEVNNKKLKNVINICLILLLTVTAVTYSALDYMGIKRENTVNEGINNDYSTVEIIEYPKSIEHIQWSSNFIEKETYINRYKKFKDIPSDKETKVIPYKQ